MNVPDFHKDFGPPFLSHRIESEIILLVEYWQRQKGKRSTRKDKSKWAMKCLPHKFKSLEMRSDCEMLAGRVREIFSVDIGEVFLEDGLGADISIFRDICEIFVNIRDFLDFFCFQDITRFSGIFKYSEILDVS